MRFHQAVTFVPTLQALEVAKAADEQGYDGLYVSDHMFFPRHRRSRYTYSTRQDGAPSFGDHWDPDTEWPDSWCFVSAMAAVTRRLRFTTGVYIAPARDLITVAKQVGTAAVLSSGRVAMGVGVGWCEEEFAATGQDFHNRGKRLDDMIPALRALWGGGWVEYHGAVKAVAEAGTQDVLAYAELSGQQIVRQMIGSHEFDGGGCQNPLVAEFAAIA